MALCSTKLSISFVRWIIKSRRRHPSRYSTMIIQMDRYLLSTLALMNGVVLWRSAERPFALLDSMRGAPFAISMHRHNATQTTFFKTPVVFLIRRQLSAQQDRALAEQRAHFCRESLMLLESFICLLFILFGLMLSRALFLLLLFVVECSRARLRRIYRPNQTYDYD